MGFIKNFINNSIDEFDKTMFPCYRCFLCGRETEDTKLYLCENCKKLIKIIKPPICVKCGMPLNEFNMLCDNCKETANYFDEARASFLFDENSSYLFHKLKYDGDKYVAKMLGKYIAKTLSDWKIKVDIIIPVPLHKKRLKQRGYNQSELIADEVSVLTGIEVRTDLIIKEKHTVPQTKLSREDRKENLKDAFKYISNEKIAGKNILILDDVVTTGATTNEIAKLLRRHRPSKIYVISAGKTQIFQ